jgi:hypothetical protein
MRHHRHPPDDRWLRALPAPTKVNYFYGLLLTEELLRKEQRYSEGALWQMNRLTVGWGVLTGLDFTIDPNKPQVTVQSGVALDGFGRPIVVPGGPADGTCEQPHAHELCAVDDHNHETPVSADATGAAFLAALGLSPGDIKAKPVDLELQIAYAEQMTDPVRALGGHCAEECEPSTVRERYRIRVRRLPTPLPFQSLPAAVDEERVRRTEDGAVNPGWKSGNLWSVFPQEPEESIRHRRDAQGWFRFTATSIDALTHHVPPVPPAMLTAVEAQKDLDFSRQQFAEVVDQILGASGTDEVRKLLWHVAKYDLTVPAFPDHASTHELPWVTIGVVQVLGDWTSDARTSLKGLSFAKPPHGRYYRQLFSNDALSRLVFALTDRVDEAARVRTLTYAGGTGASGEGQSGPVYRTLPTPLQVKLVDSLGNVPADLGSTRVRFEVLTADGGGFATDANDTAPFPAATQSSTEVGFDAHGLSAPVYWRLSYKPGAHTVSARLLANWGRGATPRGGVAPTGQSPAFHPGSQLVFHATATQTAPKVIGLDLRDWHTPVSERCVRWWKDHVKLRIVFSRKMKDDVLKDPSGWLKVWSMYTGSCDPKASDHIAGPAPITLKYLESDSVGKTDDPHGPWYADYCPDKILEPLHEHFTLRMLVILLPSAGPSAPALTDRGDPLYPNEQRLDGAFAGSYLTAADRHALWYPSPLTGSTDPCDVWHRFEPRERALPSGDGTAGTGFPHEFHRTYQFKLPCPC